MLKLELLYYPTNDPRPLRVANISDERLVALASRTAIREAESTAHELSAVDRGLADMQLAEVGRLRRVLGLFLLELKSPASTTAA